MPGNLIHEAAKSTNRKIVAGQHTTVAAADAVTFSQFTTIESINLSLQDNAADAVNNVSATISGNVATIKTWKHDGTDPTPVATTSFGVVVNYIITGY